MKYDCDKKEDRLNQWHDWFAWHPVRIGRNDCRWWEVVQRKGTLEYGYAKGPYWSFEYKAAVKFKL